MEQAEVLRQSRRETVRGAEHAVQAEVTRPPCPKCPDCPEPTEKSND